MMLFRSVSSREMAAKRRKAEQLMVNAKYAKLIS